LGNNSFRDFQYAGDAVRMAVELLEKGQFGEVYNMGSEDGIKIYDLANLIGELMGHDKIEIITDEKRVRPWEIWHLQSDNTKLYSVISYRPQVDLREALKRTIKYFYDNGKEWVF
jgi:nucleoside-diphosphate-sugar epimerase